jgi:hypothetical protein
MRVIAASLSLFLALFLAGCSATGSVKYDANLSKFKTVYFADDISLFDQKYLPTVAHRLEQDGFKVVSKSEAIQPSLMCKFVIDQSNVFGFRVHVSLWDGNDMLAVAEAKNNGWGTAIAGETAAQNLVASALDELDKQLQQAKMNPHN